MQDYDIIIDEPENYQDDIITALQDISLQVTGDIYGLVDDIPEYDEPLYATMN